MGNLLRERAFLPYNLLMRKGLLFLVAAGFLMGAFSFYDWSQAADCTINSLNWQKDSAVIGEGVGMVANGNGCQDARLSFNIYETDTLANDLIATVEASSNTTGQVVTARYIFTTADYSTGGNEFGGETMIFKPVVDGKELDRSSPTLNLAKPTGVAGSCRLSSAKWNHNTRNGPIVGTPTQMIVKGVNCANEPINYHIWEEDGLNDDNIAEVAGKFNSDGTEALTVYKLNAAGAGDNYGSYEFYFIVQVGDSSVQSENLLVPVNSETGCLNCNNGNFQPDVLKCADGTEVERGINQSYKGLCSAHVGDALGNTGTGGDGTNGWDTWDGPSSISLQGGDFGFKLTNPWCPKDEPDCKGSIEDIVLWALGLLLNLGITLAILFVVYNGFKLMVSAGDVGKVTAARKGIGYAALGLLLMLIGKGFVTLILSILETLGKK